MQDLTGEKFGRWTVLSYDGLKHSHRYWMCKCDCGTIKRVRQADMLNDISLSCGCLVRDNRISHGMTNHPLYGIWHEMIKRCSDPKHKAYKNYGGRGVTVCEEWLDVRSFIDWAESLWKPGLQIDRKDNDGGYSITNCQFTTAEVNVNNRRLIHNPTGFAGVGARHGRFTASIKSKRPPCNGKTTYLGAFDTKEEAEVARNNFILKHGLLNRLQEIK